MRPSTRQQGPSFRRLVFGVFLGGLVFATIGLGTLALVSPQWLAMPGALLQMTGQGVRRHVGRAARPNSAGSTAAGGLGAPVASTGGVLLPQGRFTVLLLGSDNDLKFPASAVLTQSMILVSIDPTTRDVAMVSIPRDFWVPIPRYGNAKIDVAYEVGGIDRARATVESLFGIKVDYYAWVGLSGLIKVIDSVGGVDITVLHPVLDEMYPDDISSPNPYAYFRLYIPAGPQHLDGRAALEYVRSRHGDLQSDFGRSARQQQVLLAIKQLATNPSMLGQIPNLVTALQGSVKTDLTLPQIVQLATLAKGIPPSQIHREILSAPRYATLGWSPDHTEQIVIPEWGQIRPEIARLLHLHAPNVTPQLADEARQENASIAVLNGAGETNLGLQWTDYFSWQGLRTLPPGNADRLDHARSELLVHNQTKSKTVQLLQTILHARVINQPTSGSSPDITVIVGKDHPPIPVPVTNAS